MVGAGFGGLGAALALAERGSRVVVLERLTYPGGCASSFRRGGPGFEPLRFEWGATQLRSNRALTARGLDLRRRLAAERSPDPRGRQGRLLDAHA